MSCLQTGETPRNRRLLHHLSRATCPTARAHRTLGDAHLGAILFETCGGGKGYTNFTLGYERRSTLIEVSVTQCYVANFWLERLSMAPVTYTEP